MLLNKTAAKLNSRAKPQLDKEILFLFFISELKFKIRKCILYDYK